MKVLEFVIINGKEVNVEDLPDKEDFFRRLNEHALESLGYRREFPEDETESKTGKEIVEGGE